MSSRHSAQLFSISFFKFVGDIYIPALSPVVKLGFLGTLLFLELPRSPRKKWNIQSWLSGLLSIQYITPVQPIAPSSSGSPPSSLPSSPLDEDSRLVACRAKVSSLETKYANASSILRNMKEVSDVAKTVEASKKAVATARSWASVAESLAKLTREVAEEIETLRTGFRLIKRAKTRKIMVSVNGDENLIEKAARGELPF